MKYFMTIVASGFLVSASFALTLKEKKELKAANDYIAGDEGYAKTAKEKCGVDFKTTIDEKMVGPFLKDNFSVGSSCGAGVEALADLCGKDEETKKAVVDKIKSVKCMLGEKEKASYKINGSVLEMTIGAGAPNLNYNLKEYLENNL